MANDEREQTLNQLLAEMDGFDPSTGVVVVGGHQPAGGPRPRVAAPRPIRPSGRDPASQPGGAQGHLGGAQSRASISAADVDLGVVARGTPGFSGADLANLVNEAAIVAVRHDRDVITPTDLDEARDRIILGSREAANALLPEEKHSVAVHEAGHALVALFSPHADPVAKVTILPAGTALGVTEQLPDDERHLYRESYLYDSLAVRLGRTGFGAARARRGIHRGGQRPGRVPPSWLFAWSVTGASRPALGPVGYGQDGPGYLGVGQGQSKEYSEGTQQVIDEEVSRLLREAEERARTLLSDHRTALDATVERLMERETISGDDLADVVRRVDDTKPPAQVPDGEMPSL